MAQDDLKKKIDSILTEVNGLEYNDRKLSYRDLNYLIIKNKPEKASELFEYALSKDSSDVAKLVIYDSYSKNLSSRGFTDESLQLKFKGLEVAETLEDELEITLYHVTIANSYCSKNMPDKAIYHLNIAEPLANKKENWDLLWTVYYNRAEVQILLKDFDKASEYYLKMWDIFKYQENSGQKRFVLYTLAHFYSQVDYPLEQIKFTELLAQHYEDAYSDMPPGHSPITSLFSKSNSEENIPKYKNIIKVSDSLNSINSFVHTSIALSDTYLKIDQPQNAVRTLEEVVKKLKGLEKPQQLMNAYALLSNANIATNNYQKAYNFKILESKLRDSITANKMQKNIAEMEVKFDTEKKEREILEQKSIIAEKNQQRNLILYGSIALGIVSILTVLFFRNKLKFQKKIADQNEVLQQQKITELNQKNKLLALNSMIEGQEAERLRIAKDLHDSLGGLLSTVKAHFSTIQKEIEQLEKMNITEKTNTLIDEACIEVRRISHNMMPHALSISGIEGALEDLGERLNEEGYNASIEISNLPDDLDDTKKVMVYRLIQEVISNIRKHAEAKSVLIQLLGYKDELNLIIEDDGKGFNYDEAISKGGLGLKSINSRVEFLNGTIDWDSQTEKGTLITINIPIS